jgi:hypothetical protein
LALNDFPRKENAFLNKESKHLTTVASHPHFALASTNEHAIQEYSFLLPLF